MELVRAGRAFNGIEIGIEGKSEKRVRNDEFRANVMGTELIKDCLINYQESEEKKPKQSIVEVVIELRATFLKLVLKTSSYTAHQIGYTRSCPRRLKGCNWERTLTVLGPLMDFWNAIEI